MRKVSLVGWSRGTTHAPVLLTSVTSELTDLAVMMTSTSHRSVVFKIYVDLSPAVSFPPHSDIFCSLYSCFVPAPSRHCSFHSFTFRYLSYMPWHTHSPAFATAAHSPETTASSANSSDKSFHCLPCPLGARILSSL